jgi:sec-independent protein translocase protein TatB
MFGLSWGQIGIIVLVGVFVLGPERIPTAIAGAVAGLRKVRALVAGAQADTLGQIGPELAELRRQLAELQALAGVPELRELHPEQLLTPAPAAEAPAAAVAAERPSH